MKRVMPEAMLRATKKTRMTQKSRLLRVSCCCVFIYAVRLTKRSAPKKKTRTAEPPAKVDDEDDEEDEEDEQDVIDGGEDEVDSDDAADSEVRI